MVGCHHWLNAHEFGWTPGVGDGQGSLASCDSRGCKESDVTEQLNWTEAMFSFLKFFFNPSSPSRRVLFSEILLLVHFLAKRNSTSFSIKQISYLQKNTPNFQQKNQLSRFSSIIKFKGLPFLRGQTVVPLPLSPRGIWWHHFLINKLTQVHRCALSILLDRLVQACPIQNKPTAFCPTQAGKLLPLPCCRPAMMSTRWLRFVNLAGVLIPKIMSLLKAGARTKCCFLLCLKQAQISSWRKEICSAPM